MPPAPPIEEVVAALAEAWTRHPVTDGFRLETDRAEAPGPATPP
ncbi:hypothetical protein CLV52_2481 [Amnibacterium kyonggiense]|uniref:Uncharacterized protein n=1 Tax=Amnibacterium kyonggiense TaxID=595671 RepID=A0A4R7FMH5_9MICO|nr:hypothetical protein CLV52_2481 [Amnibacterium kyonggiense]